MKPASVGPLPPMVVVVLSGGVTDEHAVPYGPMSAPNGAAKTVAASQPTIPFLVSFGDGVIGADSAAPQVPRPP